MDTMTLQNIMTALQEDRIEAFFQPLFEIWGGECTGIEILVRIISSEKNIILPESFITALENSSVTLSVTERLMNKTAYTLSVLHSILPSNFTVAFNICADLLNNPELKRICNDFQQKTPSNITLCLELTERKPFHHDREEEVNILTLRQMGVKIVLDDFGTGHSNMSLLTYAIDGLKIPKAFIAFDEKMSIQHIIEKNMVMLAKEMDIDITAEGVETLNQYNRLKDLGINYFQGYLFSQPLSIHVLSEYLRRNNVIFTKKTS